MSVSLTPPQASLVAGASAQFEATVHGAADTAVTWSVQEGAVGGTVTGAGLYTSPSVAGTYHVVAASVADPTKSAAAAVTVTAAPGMVSDYTPAVGAASAPGSAGTPTGPWNTRVLLATSPDGSHWTKLDRGIGDQTNVPSVIAWQNKIWVYHVAWHAADHPDWEHFLAAAVSDDLQHWTYKRLVFSNATSDLLATDPTAIVVAAEPNKVRLYFTYASKSNPNAPSSTWSAISSDGVTFALEGQAYSSSQGVADPQVLWIGDRYEFFAGYWMWVQNMTLHHATSVDGRSFSALPMWNPGARLYLNNGARLADGRYAWYGTDLVQDNGSGGVRAYYWQNGEWVYDSTVLLGINTPRTSALEREMVVDAAVVAWPPVGNLMAYMTRIP